MEAEELSMDRPCLYQASRPAATNQVKTVARLKGTIVQRYLTLDEHKLDQAVVVSTAVTVKVSPIENKTHLMPDL